MASHAGGASARRIWHLVLAKLYTAAYRANGAVRRSDSRDRRRYDVDIVSVGNVAGLLRFTGLVWQGEKAALRYWAVHDPEYLGLVRRCLDTQDRLQRVAAYRVLMERTIQPIGAPFNKGETALILEDPSKHALHLRMTLDYWNGLFA